MSCSYRLDQRNIAGIPQHHHSQHTCSRLPMVYMIRIVCRSASLHRPFLLPAHMGPPCYKYKKPLREEPGLINKSSRISCITCDKAEDMVINFVRGVLNSILKLMFLFSLCSNDDSFFSQNSYSRLFFVDPFHCILNLKKSSYKSKSGGVRVITGL
ncbi:unnamed protein product [Moneuplotes crassus]|uniref:Uncharacterized protein n=1 Tax=Euplotes crassus TaxID=5936 RepID=A0AAD1UPQ6_EUPCR|nr:unnamed protein product [Moneuplotes crassus]